MTVTINRAIGFVDAVQRIGAPAVDLLIRVALFRVFFWSGLVKIHDWPGTLQLFKYEYMVPVLPTDIAAVLAAACELGASSLVLIGLFSRLAALPLLGMSMVIQFVLGSVNPAYNDLEHYLWMVLLLSVIVRGAGILSVDGYLRQRLLPMVGTA
ncbi:MAG TPA: DoxX family protein [Dongiaceae bacterium]|nr:DoxX family protein [Dongiaceae bacterium]